MAKPELVIMERGSDYKRGRSPLYIILHTSPTSSNCDYLLMVQVGEGQGRGQQILTRIEQKGFLVSVTHGEIEEAGKIKL